MKPTWIDINGGGLLRADSVALIYRADQYETHGEVPAILTSRLLELRTHTQRLDDLVRQVEAYGVRLLRCRRRLVHGMPDHWHDVWLNLGLVLCALPTPRGHTEVYLDWAHDSPLELEDPVFTDIMAALRGLSSRPM